MPESPNRSLRVFLCHSSNDKPTVRELYRKLRAEGWIDVWFDEENLLPGQNWTLEIEKAVEGSDVVIVCLSDSSVTREGYLQKELRIVLDIADEKPEGTIFVIPLRLQECQVPRSLKNWQYVDYSTKNDRDQAYRRLLLSLSNRAKVLGIARDNAGSKARPATSLPGASTEERPGSFLAERVSEESDRAQNKLAALGARSRKELTTAKADESVMALKQIFISYSRNDVDFATKLNADLSRNQMKTWMDQLGIRSGEDWPDRIAKAILESSIVLVVVSPSAFESKWVKRELSFADKNGKLIFPLVHTTCMFPHWFDLRFGNTQRADFTKGVYKDNLEKLIDSLKNILNESN